VTALSTNTDGTRTDDCSSAVPDRPPADKEAAIANEVRDHFHPEAKQRIANLLLIRLQPQGRRRFRRSTSLLLAIEILGSRSGAG
jgi:hypothetical protein